MKSKFFFSHCFLSDFTHFFSFYFLFRESHLGNTYFVPFYFIFMYFCNCGGGEKAAMAESNRWSSLFGRIFIRMFIIIYFVGMDITLHANINAYYFFCKHRRLPSIDTTCFTFRQENKLNVAFCLLCRWYILTF